jgi:putative endonuclease
VYCKYTSKTVPKLTKYLVVLYNFFKDDKMARQQKIGKLGEDVAVQLLADAGYLILERNWRFSKAEVDIIAKDRSTLVFIEVKSRSYTYFGEPEESVSAYKENLLVDAANRYMASVGHTWEIRFDVISVIFDKSLQAKITHFKDAFFPGL